MPAQLLDGKALSRSIRADLRLQVDVLRARGIVPRLAALVASQDPASLAYVRMKRSWAEKMGIESESITVDDSMSTADVVMEIGRLNADPSTHGVLIQHPMPSQIDEPTCLAALDPEKDVDGITPTSMGRLLAGTPGFRCATPLGIIALLDHYGVEIAGKRAIVIGRSVILGKPAALMLLERHATVTIAHSRTQGLRELVRECEVVVAAVGRAEMVTGDWIRPGAVVVDAGYNRVVGRDHDVGDCDFGSCVEVASWITPVPGGVGPMTVASLLSNTVRAAESALVP